MQPFKYMSEVASTKTFRSSNLKTLSIMPAWFSNDIEYWNPEQPPPTTPMRRPAGSGSCVAMISRTLAMAPSVILRGDCFGGLDCSVKGCAMVAISLVLPGRCCSLILRRLRIPDKFYPNCRLVYKDADA